MQISSVAWTKWANNLARFKAKALTAWILEIFEPLMPIGAQMLYISQPLIGYNRANDLAQLLEDKEETRAFAIFLRKE